MKRIHIRCQGNIDLNYNELHPLQGNLKDLSKENYEKLKKSIIELGFSEPCSVWLNEGKWWILNAHQRLRTIKQMVETEGYECPPLPCSVIQATDETEAKRKILALTSQYGEITKQGLYEFISESDIDIESLDDFRFPEIELDEFKTEYVERSDGQCDPDEVPEPPNEIKGVNTGDLFVLGDHRLLCGDSTKKEYVDRVMNGEKADMVYTDPPYGMQLDCDYSSMKSAIGPKSNRYENVINDDKEYDPSFIISYFKYCNEVFLWGCDYYYSKLPRDGSLVVWDKRNEEGMTLERQNSLSRTFGSAFEICWSKNKHQRSICRELWNGMFGMGGDDEHKRVHPTQKPIKLVEWFFNRWGKNSKLIVDIYLGSGSTLIACEKTNRKCYGIEIDPHYCAVILDRWEKYTGKQAFREDGKSWEEIKNGASKDTKKDN